MTNTTPYVPSPNHQVRHDLQVLAHNDLHRAVQLVDMALDEADDDLRAALVDRAFAMIRAIHPAHLKSPKPATKAKQPGAEVLTSLLAVREARLVKAQEPALDVDHGVSDRSPDRVGVASHSDRLDHARRDGQLDDLLPHAPQGIVPSSDVSHDPTLDATAPQAGT